LFPMHYETTMAQVGNNTGIPVPTEVLDTLGEGRRPAVALKVNGFEYRSTVGSMNGEFLVPFSAALRAESGIAGGDALAVDIELDTAPRTVEPPADLAKALDAAGIRSAFDALSPSRQKAHVTSVESAKTEQTRARRVAKVVAELGG